MSQEEKTPVDGRSTIEIFASDMHATKLAAQNTETIQLRMYEEFKQHRQDLADQRRRAWVPALVSVLAALVSFACAVAAAPH